MTLDTGLPVFQPVRLRYSTPLVPSTGPFKKCAQELGLEEATAAILDDIRFLVETVLSMPPAPSPPEAAKLKSLSDWMDDRISAIRPEACQPADDVSRKPSGADSGIHRCVQLAALIFCRAIRSRTVLSKACSQKDALELVEAIQQVPLETWKSLLGVLHWLLTAVAPSSRGTDQSVHMLLLATLQMGLGDWTIVVCASRRILQLQVWLARGDASALTGPETRETSVVLTAQ